MGGVYAGRRSTQRDGDGDGTQRTGGRIDTRDFSGARLSFVSHYDCARHDTGWGHPDHQGRLPAVMRAVYADMLTLFPHLREVEGRPAVQEAVRRVHTDDYLKRLRGWVREAEEKGAPLVVEPGVVVSGASWDAAMAAAGCVLTAVDQVLDGGPPRAFCATRPPGAGAHADGPAGFALLNSVAIGARHALDRAAGGGVLVIEWSGLGDSAIPELLSGVAGTTVLSLDPDEYQSAAALLDGLRGALASCDPAGDLALVLLANGLDILAADPLGRLDATPADVYELTTALVEWAEERCGGRIVSALEGGYAPSAVGAAVVQHLRALAGLPRAA